MSCTRKERNLAAENSNFPNTQYRQMPPHPSPRLLPILAPLTRQTSPPFILFTTLRYYRIAIQQQQTSCSRNTVTHDDTVRTTRSKENDNLEPRAVIAHELNFDSNEFLLDRRIDDSLYGVLSRKKSDHVVIRWQSRSTHLVMLHDGSGLSLGGHIQFQRACLSSSSWSDNRISVSFLPRRYSSSALCLARAIGFTLTDKLRSKQPKHGRSRDTKDRPMFFIYRTSFARSSDLSLYLIQSRNNNTNRIHVRIDRWY